MVIRTVSIATVADTLWLTNRRPSLLIRRSNSTHLAPWVGGGRGEGGEGRGGEGGVWMGENTLAMQ